MNGIVVTRQDDIMTFNGNIIKGTRGIIIRRIKYGGYYEAYFPHINWVLFLRSNEFSRCKKDDCKDCQIRFQCWTS